MSTMKTRRNVTQSLYGREKANDRGMQQEYLSTGECAEAVRKLCKNLLRYMKEYTDEFLFIEQACNSPMATDEMIEELEQYNQNTITIFQRGVQEGILKQTSPALLISFCYYPIQQIFKEWRKEKSMLPDVDFEVVFQMCWDAIKR